MCRLTAYSGPSIPLENIITRPVHSLLSQSQHATEAKLAVNGDGFGFAWYQEHQDNPGLYRDVLPAWSDGNLTSLCRMIRAPLFLAHVRASTSGETSRTNCHPFTFKRWSFCHNGQIPAYPGNRRVWEAQLPDQMYNARRGTTDSELLFLSLLAQGLEDNPQVAIAEMLNRLKAEPGAGPNRITCVFTDGESLYAFRHASDDHAPSLYLSKQLDNGGTAFASEPLCGNHANWTEVPSDTLMIFNNGRITSIPLALTA